MKINPKSKLLDILFNLKDEPSDITPLHQWLRANSKEDIFCRFAQTGSRRFFCTGSDTDFLVDITDIPDELQHLVPSPNYISPDSENDECSIVSLLRDEERPELGKLHFIIGSPERTAEFIFASNHFGSICRDPESATEVWQLLQTNKPLRVAVFRALRHAYPDSTLTH